MENLSTETHEGEPQNPSGNGACGKVSREGRCPASPKPRGRSGGGSCGATSREAEPRKSPVPGATSRGAGSAAPGAVSRGAGVAASGGAASFRLVEWRRRAAILTQPKLPCLSPYHTLNLTAGCPNECRYCYAQSYAHHPGWGTVAFYANVLERFREEFPRMRTKPTMVYFSTASEPFLPVDRILDDLYAIMEILLAAGSRLLISTKGIVQPRFAELFARYPGKAHVQVGITTVDDGVRALMEPRASTVEERLANLELLARHGVTAEARLDPLLPGLTDVDLSLDALFYELSRRGLRRAAASFLFLRWGIRPPWGLRYGDWTFQEMRKLYTHKVTDYCGGGTIWLPPTEYRRERFRDMKTLAEAHGIVLHACGCKNVDLIQECCHPQPRRPPDEPTQAGLFDPPRPESPV